MEYRFGSSLRISRTLGSPRTPRTPRTPQSPRNKTNPLVENLNT